MKAAILLAACLSAFAAKIPVWIDTDPSVQPGGHEVDDGFALVQAFHSPELAIRGVSAVFGNAPLDIAFPKAKDITTRFGPKGLKVYKGAASGKDLGVENEATRALTAALKKESLIIFVLGPATNVATVLNKHPELRSKVKEIIAVAGRRIDQHFTTGTKAATPFRDFNFEMDPQAFRILLDSHLPIVLAPWEISSKVWLKADDLEKIKAANAAGAYLYGPASDWLKMWNDRFGVDGGNPFDTLAIAYVTSPALLKCEDLPADIQTLADDTKRFPEKPYLLVDREIATGKKVKYCYEASPGFKEDLMKRLTAK